MEQEKTLPPLPPLSFDKDKLTDVSMKLPPLEFRGDRAFKKVGKYDVEMTPDGSVGKDFLSGLKKSIVEGPTRALESVADFETNNPRVASAVANSLSGTARDAAKALTTPVDKNTLPGMILSRIGEGLGVGDPQKMARRSAGFIGMPDLSPITGELKDPLERIKKLPSVLSGIGSMLPGGQGMLGRIMWQNPDDSAKWWGEVKKNLLPSLANMVLPAAKELGTAAEPLSDLAVGAAGEITGQPVVREPSKLAKDGDGTGPSAISNLVSSALNVAGAGAKIGAGAAAFTPTKLFDFFADPSKTFKEDPAGVAIAFGLAGAGAAAVKALRANIKSGQPVSSGVLSAAIKEVGRHFKVGMSEAPSIEARITEAISKLPKTGSGWANISDIKKALPDVPPEAINKTILEMEKGKKAIAYPIDDNQFLAKNPEIAQGGLEVAGFPRHIVKLTEERPVEAPVDLATKIADYGKIRAKFLAEGNKPAAKAIEAKIAELSKQKTSGGPKVGMSVEYVGKKITSEDVQREIDAKIDELMTRGKSFSEADDSPEVLSLYKTRDAIDRNDLTDARTPLAMAIESISPGSSGRILREVFGIGEANDPLAVPMAAKYAQASIADRKASGKKIAEIIVDEYGKSHGLDMSGALNRNISGWTDSGIRGFLKSVVDKANRILDSVESSIVGEKPRAGMSVEYVDDFGNPITPEGPTLPEGSPMLERLRGSLAKVKEEIDRGGLARSSDDAVMRGIEAKLAQRKPLAEGEIEFLANRQMFTQALPTLTQDEFARISQGIPPSWYVKSGRPVEDMSPEALFGDVKTLDARNLADAAKLEQSIPATEVAPTAPRRSLGKDLVASREKAAGGERNLLQDLYDKLDEPFTPESDVDVLKAAVQDFTKKVGLNVQATDPTGKPTGESTYRVARLAQRMADAAKALGVERDAFGRLPEYAVKDNEIQMGLAKALVDADPEMGLNMALGKSKSPEGVLNNSVFRAVKEKAVTEGDIDTLRRLGTESTRVQEATRAGQEIQILGERDIEDPVVAMEDIQAERAARHARVTGRKPTPEKDAPELARLREELEKVRAELAAKTAEKTGQPIETRPKPTYGSRNRVVKQDAYLAAKEELRKSFGATAYMGLDPTILENMVKVGVYHLEAGARSFGSWSKKIIEDVGEGVRPHLEEAWKASREKLGQAYQATQKKMVAGRAEKFEKKLAEMDFEKPEPIKVPVDKELADLRAREARAKANYAAAAQKAGTLTYDEAAKLVELSQEVASYKSDMELGGDRFKYGAARVAYTRFIDELKRGDVRPGQRIKDRIGEFKTTWKGVPEEGIEGNKSLAIWKAFKDAVEATSDTAISLAASIDNSFLGRQGLITLQTHPSIYKGVFANSFKDAFKALAKKEGYDKARDALMADVFSRPNYMNGDYVKYKMIVPHEEQFPTSAPGRIPGIGRVFKASEVAFMNSAIRARLNTYDLLWDIAKKNGIDRGKIDPKIAEQYASDFAKLANAATGRSDLGKMGQGGAIRLVLWAPKMLKANLEVLTAHGGGMGLKTNFARKQAALNLGKIVAETAGVAALINALSPGSVETDPRSSDFGKAKFGNTRFDLTGGRGSIVTLLWRFASGKSKSSTTGAITDLRKGGPFNRNLIDVGLDFLLNKTTPLAGVIRDELRGQTFAGEKPSLGSAATNLLVPISVRNFVQNFWGDDPDGSVASILGSVADVFGISVNTYRKQQKKASSGYYGGTIW